LAGSADGTIALHTRWKRFGFLTETLRLFGKAFFKGCGLLETTSLHDAAPF
jgi:hypothetical protein